MFERACFVKMPCMEKMLIEATEAAIHQVDGLRFFQTERGFHGRFYSALQSQLDHLGLMIPGAVLEMEYQKSSRHRLTQRPDIVFHIPVEHSGDVVQKNNFAVWALKHRASAKEAESDFDHLDEMFRVLHYAFGFFLNIDSREPMRQHYSGDYEGRFAAVAANLSDGRIQTRWALPR